MPAKEWWRSQTCKRKRAKRKPGEWWIEDFTALTPGDITRAFKGTADEAAANGGGTISLPAGHLFHDPVIISTAKDDGGPPLYDPCANMAIYIEGQKEGVTYLRGCPPAGQAMLRWDCSAIPAGYQSYGGLRNISIHSTAAPSDTPGNGVEFDSTVFTSAEHVWIRGFNKGIASLNCQDQVFRDVHTQCNMTGLWVDGANQVRLDSFYVNQNVAVGVQLLGGIIAWQGGLLQGSENTASLLLNPRTANNVHFSIRDVYIEHGGSAPVILGLPPMTAPTQYSGSLRVEDCNWNVSEAMEYMVDLANYALFAEKWAQGCAAPWLRMLKGQLYAAGLPSAPGRFFVDAATMPYVDWRGPGGVELLPEAA